jgi:hypothetical protein
MRWGNVARAAGAALAVVLVVAWPRLAPPEPALPGTAPAPLDDRGGWPPVERVDGAAKRAGGGERRRPKSRAGADRTPRRSPGRTRHDDNAGTSRADGDGDDAPGGGGGTNMPGGGGGTNMPDLRGDGGGATNMPDLGGDGGGATTVPGAGGGEGTTNVPGGDDERAAAPALDPAPVEFGFERP